MKRTIAILLTLTLMIAGYTTEAKNSPKLARQPLKVLCVCGQFPVLSNVFILNQLTGLVKRDIDLTIFSYREGEQTIHPDVLKYNLLDLAYYKKLPSDMKSYDIILCQFGDLGLKFLKIKKELKLKAKLVTCFRGYDISRTIKINGQHVYDELFAQGDLFLPVCDYIKNTLIKVGCNPRKIQVHHSAIDLTRFPFKPHTPSNNTITIVSVGRLVPKKGLHYAIEAISSLLQKYPNIQYKIMGDGQLKEELSQAIRNHNAQHAITLLGSGTSNEVASLLQTADLFILPSITDEHGNQEGIPNVLKEAMASGVPVISTYHGGITELVEQGKTGLLVPCGDSKALASAIEYAIQNRAELNHIRLAARTKVVQEYDTETLNDQLVRLFSALLYS